MVFKHLSVMRAQGLIPGRITGNSPCSWKIGYRTVALGVSPQKGNTHSLQGIHDRYLLVIVDEGCGIPRDHWAGMLSWSMGEHNRVMVIGNPTDRETAFGDACEDNEHWNTIKMAVNDSPHFTGEHMTEKMRESLPNKEDVATLRQSWSIVEQNARLDAVFPDVNSLAIFDMRKFPTDQSSPPVSAVHAGIDVAGEGRDRTVVYARKDDVVWNVPLPDATEGDPYTLASMISPKLKELGVKTVAVDALGPGAQLSPRLVEQLPGVNIEAVLTGNPAYDENQFYNRRAELHWAYRLCAAYIA